MGVGKTQIIQILNRKVEISDDLENKDPRDIKQKHHKTGNYEQFVLK